MTTARQRVLAYIQKERSASAAEIGRGLDMSAATVRHHLSLLLADGRISTASENRHHDRRRGRPAKRYRLSEALVGDNLAQLSDVLLDMGQRSLPPAHRELFLQGLSRGICDLIGFLPAKVPIAKRLAEVVEKLNRRYYQARWEAGPEGPRILFGHCPYAAIIQKHPELCRMDTILLREAAGMSVDQQAKIQPGSNGSNYCIFLLH